MSTIDRAGARAALLNLAANNPQDAAKQLNEFAKSVTALGTEAGRVLRDVFAALTQSGMSRSELSQYSNIAKFMRKDAPKYKDDTEQALAELKFPRLSAKASIEQKLQTFIRANAGDDRFFEDVDSGNCGLHAYLLEGAAAANFVYLSAQYDKRRGGVVPSFDPAKAIVVGVVLTNDEPEIDCLILDEATFRPLFVERYNPCNFVDLEGDLPSAIKSDQRLKDDSGEVDPFRVAGVLLGAGKEIPLKHKDKSNAEWGVDAFLE